MKIMTDPRDPTQKIAIGRAGEFVGMKKLPPSQRKRERFIRRNLRKEEEDRW